MKKITIVLFILIAANTVSAQTEVLKDNGSWFTFVSNVKLSEKFNFTFLTQQRRVGFLENTQGFLYTPSISYKLTSNVSVGAGYLFYRYYTEGALHGSINKDENRLFQYISLNTKAGKFKIGQRFGEDIFGTPLRLSVFAFQTAEFRRGNLKRAQDPSQSW